MTDSIVKILNASGVYGWEVSDVKTNGWEFYFIRHELDQHRAKNVEHINVKVYQLTDDGQSIGFASAEIAPTATQQEIEKLVSDLAYRATLVKNRPFTLTPPSEEQGSDGKASDIADISADFIRAVSELPETEGEDINSYEIFVSDVIHRLITSTGIDETEHYPSSMIEVIVNARREGHEIELYRSYISGTCDAAGLKRDLVKTMNYGRDRLTAGPTPINGKFDVLFSGSDACQIYNYFSERMNAALIYRQMSDYEIGKPICAEFSGDKVTVKALRELNNSSQNHAFDEEGAVIRDTVLIEDGVAKNYVGGRMFSSYLGLEKSFNPTNIEVTGGSRSEEELRSGQYLEVVEFSDFQVDEITGDIFGEIRLAYLHDGEKTVAVTGGSISGSMNDFVGNMLMSKNSVQYDSMKIPALTLLRGVTVTGAEQ